MHFDVIEPFSQPNEVAAIVTVYQQAFGGSPWHEGFRCPVCETVCGLIPALVLCPVCEEQGRAVLLVEYWPRSRVLADFYGEMKRLEALCVVAREGSTISGFAWGYRISITTELDTQLDAPGLSQVLVGDFFYLDECAVLPAVQGCGIGTSMLNQLFRQQRVSRVLLRTRDQSHMQRMIFRRGGSVVQHIAKERVIMTLEL